MPNICLAVKASFYPKGHLAWQAFSHLWIGDQLVYLFIFLIRAPLLVHSQHFFQLSKLYKQPLPSIIAPMQTLHSMWHYCTAQYVDTLIDIHVKAAFFLRCLIMCEMLYVEGFQFETPISMFAVLPDWMKHLGCRLNILLKGYMQSSKSLL